MIRYAKQTIDQADIDSVIKTLSSDFLTSGPAVENFEAAVCEYTGAKYAVAMSNATACLHVACMSFDLGKGDWLWTTPNTFVASANCGLYCDAEVDFVDIDSKTYNICVNALEEKLIKAEQSGKLPKVLVIVDFAGAPCELKKIKTLSQTYGFKILEDASHAIGGRFENTKIGCCDFSDFCVFSFHPVKIMTTGEGGILTTNDQKLYEKAKLLRSHGITRDERLFCQASHGPWYYEQQHLGYNYRITDIQCALGLSQLQKVDDFISKRHELASRYDKHLSDLPVRLPFRDPRHYSALHLYPILIEENKKNLSRKDVFIALTENGIGVQVHYIPVHLQPVYKAKGFKENDFPNALAYYNKTLTIPLYYSLTKAQQDIVIEKLYEILI